MSDAKCDCGAARRNSAYHSGNCASLRTTARVCGYCGAEDAGGDTLHKPDCLITHMRKAGLNLDPAGQGQAEPKSFRAEMLADVAALTDARGADYGTPAENFARIARRWSVHLKNRYGIDLAIDAIDVAQMCIDLKQARIENEPHHLDSWKDSAGYAACGAEVACGTEGSSALSHVRNSES